MATGTVKYFNLSKGFGFILPEGGGPDVFVHATAVEQADLPPLAEGQRLTYDVEPDPRGAKAVNLAICLGEVASAVSGRSPRTSNNSRVSQLTIYHNPDCQNSVNALALLQTAGHEPIVVEYMTLPLTKADLKSLLVRMKLSARDVMRKVEPLYLELGLDAETVSEDVLLEAMVRNPILINRPIVATQSSARLCRPSGVVTAFLRDNEADLQ